MPLENPERVAKALVWRGLDFTDTLHLAAAGRRDTFVSFDQNLPRPPICSAVEKFKRRIDTLALVLS